MLLETTIRILDQARDAESGKEIAKQAGEDMYALLRDSATGYTAGVDQRTMWEGQLRIGEDRWCETNFGDVPEAKHVKGKLAGTWKYRTILPGPYTSAKSVIGTAIERGSTGIFTKGKSALQKENNSRKDDPEYLLEEFKKTINKALTLYTQEPDVKVRKTMAAHAVDVFGVR